MKLRSGLINAGLTLSVANSLKLELCLTKFLAQLFSLDFNITVAERKEISRKEHNFFRVLI